jgi:hypothetical protein
MTIPAGILPKVQTSCNGIATRYYFTALKIWADTDLLVMVTNDTTNVETTLTLNSDYTVSVSGKYIDLTLAASAPSGSTISLISNVPYTQIFDQAEGDDFPVSSIITALDKLTIQNLQLREMLSRTILLPQTSLITPWTLLNVEDYNVLVSVIVAAADHPTGFAAPVAYSLDANGAITFGDELAFRICTVDTLGSAATDNLESIIGGNVGELVILQNANNQREVVCKKGSSLDLQADFSLNNTKSKLFLVCTASGVFHEISRAKNI